MLISRTRRAAGPHCIVHYMQVISTSHSYCWSARILTTTSKTGKASRRSTCTTRPLKGHAPVIWTKAAEPTYLSGVATETTLWGLATAMIARCLSASSSNATSDAHHSLLAPALIDLMFVIFPCHVGILSSPLMSPAKMYTSAASDLRLGWDAQRSRCQHLSHCVTLVIQQTLSLQDPITLLLSLKLALCILSARTVWLS